MVPEAGVVTTVAGLALEDELVLVDVANVDEECAGDDAGFDGVCGALLFDLSVLLNELGLGRAPGGRMLIPTACTPALAAAFIDASLPTGVLSEFVVVVAVVGAVEVVEVIELIGPAVDAGVGVCPRDETAGVIPREVEHGVVTGEAGLGLDS